MKIRIKCLCVIIMFVCECSLKLAAIGANCAFDLQQLTDF